MAKLEIHQFPCLSDNYGVLVHDAEAGLTAVHMRSGPTTISAPGPLAGGFTTRWLGCGR